MPYLELKKENEKEEDIKQEVTVPDIRNMSIKDAKKQLKDIGLELEIKNKDESQEIKESETIIIEQTPKPGIIINSGNKIICEIN